MADTARKLFEKQTTGSNSNTWGGILNTNFDEIDKSIAGITSKTVTSADITLTDDEARSPIHLTSGTMTANRSYIVPARESLYLVKNTCAGAFTLTVKTSAGTGIVVATGTAVILYCDATNVEKFDVLDIIGLTAESSPATGDSLGFYDASALVNRRITFENFLKVITSLTAETTAALTDEVPAYDVSASAPRKFTWANIFKLLTSFTAETASATGDELAVYDVSASDIRKMTLQNILKVINLLTEDTSPDSAADFLLSYDVSASDVKKVKPSSIATGGMTLIETLAAGTGTSVTSAAFGATYKQIVVALLNVSHNSGSSQSFRVAISDDGVSFGTADVISTTQTAAATVSGHVFIFNTGSAATTKVMTAGTSSTESTGITMSMGLESSENGITTHLRFSPSSGNFDGGTFYIYGIS